jgi:DNA-binding NtrC family response regulator
VTPLAEIEKRQILHAVERCGGNRTQAAKKLGISIRTLRNKLHEYGVGTKEDAAEEEEKAAV